MSSNYVTVIPKNSAFIFNTHLRKYVSPSEIIYLGGYWVDCKSSLIIIYQCLTDGIWIANDKRWLQILLLQYFIHYNGYDEHMIAYKQLFEYFYYNERYGLECYVFRWANLGMKRYGINKMYSQLCWYCSLAVIHFISHAWMMMRRIEIKWEKVYLARYLYILMHAKRKTKIPNVLFYPRDHKKSLRQNNVYLCIYKHYSV